MGFTLENTNTLKLLPGWMRDDDAVQALAGACDVLFQGAAKRIKTPRTWDQIDNLTDEELDELAWELNIDWWQSSWSLEQKRATVKVARQIKAKRGTKWAVEQLITASFGTGYVKEWFEEGENGDPFTFKVLTTNPNIGDEGMENFNRQINQAKNERSHMIGVYYFEEIGVTIEADPRKMAHVFEYVRCGTVPRPAAVGAIDKTVISTNAEAMSHGFKYTKAGDGTITGTYPGRGTLGAIDKGTVQVDPESTTHGFAYIEAGDGTVTGIYPRQMQQGEITTQVVETDAAAALSHFDYERKVGTVPGVSTLGEISRIASEAAGTTVVHCFTYKKCGTTKCGE